MFDIFSLQVTEYSSVEEEIKNQTFQEYYIPAPRGEIYDYKNIKLVKTNIEQYLYINLRKINDENLDLYKQLIKFNFIELTNEDIEDIFNSKEVLEPIYSLQKIDFSIQKQLLEYDAFEIYLRPNKNMFTKNKLNEKNVLNKAVFKNKSKNMNDIRLKEIFICVLIIIDYLLYRAMFSYLFHKFYY